MLMNVKMKLRSKEQAVKNRSAWSVGTKHAKMQITAPATPTHPGNVTSWATTKDAAMACTRQSLK
jgi:hypothetical protein